jgi:hypothetical protein
MDALTLEDVVNKFDLRFDRIEQFLPTLVTRAELEGMQLATKADLQATESRLATKAELQATESRLATKAELEELRLATKADLQEAIAPLATKAELQEGLQSVKDELRGEIRAAQTETRDHMNILIEHVRDDIRLVIEKLDAAEARNAREHAELRLADARLDGRVMALEASRRRPRSR